MTPFHIVARLIELQYCIVNFWLEYWLRVRQYSSSVSSTNVISFEAERQRRRA